MSSLAKLSDRLLDLAFSFRKEKLWKVLSDSEIFAVALPDGQLAYCAMMGEMNEHLALGVYVGDKGLRSYRRMYSEYDDDEIGFAEHYFIVFGQECLQCSYENKDELEPRELDAVRAYAKKHGIQFYGRKSFPHLVSFKPMHHPWPLTDKKDAAILELTLEAAMDVARRVKVKSPKELGFTVGEPYGREVPLLSRKPDGKGFAWGKVALPGPLPDDFASPQLDNDILAGQLKKAAKKGCFICELCAMPNPIQETPFTVPHLTTLMIMLNEADYSLLPSSPCLDYEHEGEKLLADMAQLFLQEENFVPATIKVRSDRSEAFLRNFCQQAGIKLKRENDLPELDDTEEDLFNHMVRSGGEGRADFHDMINDLFDKLESLHADELKNLSPAMKACLRALFANDALPRYLMEKLGRVF